MQRSARRQGARAPSPDPIDYHQRAARPVAQGDAHHAETPRLRRCLLRCRHCRRCRGIRAIARHLLQLPAGMGRLGHASSRRSSRRSASRCRPTTRTPARRIAALIAEKANPVADVTYLGGIAARSGQGSGRAARPTSRRLGRHPGRPERPRRLLVHDPLRHARLLRQQGGARRQAGAADRWTTC